MPRRCGPPTPRAARKLIIRRTSEHWWEDEQEFDPLTESVLPKQVHLAVVRHTEAAPAGAAAAEAAAVEAMAAAAQAKFTTGFTSARSKPQAEALWHRLGQDGPPFFKKIRTRNALEVLEDPTVGAAAVRAAAEELWSELCSQTWRVELDYGLAGAEAVPTDRLLLALSGLGAARLLAHAELLAPPAADTTSPAPLGPGGYALVDVAGYDAAAAAAAEGGEGGAAAPRGWRDLRLRLLVCAGVVAA